MTVGPIEILVVEDDAGDALLIEEAFAVRADRCRLSLVTDGEQALMFLRNEGEHAAAPRPDLILLDLNLPRVDGREVLAAVKADDDLRHIPVIVFSTSAAPEDVFGSYSLYANAYVTKPNDFDSFAGVVHQIDRFFADVARLPRAVPPPRGVQPNMC